MRYKHELPKRSDNFGNELDGGYRREAYSQVKLLNIYACFHGLYLTIGTFKEYYLVVGGFCTESQRNYHWLSFKDTTKPYEMREYEYRQEFNYYENAKAIIESIDKDSEMEYSTIEFQDWHNSNTKKTIHNYSKEEIDYKWFLLQDTKDGVFKPEKASIDNVWTSYSPPKNLLKKTE